MPDPIKPDDQPPSDDPRIAQWQAQLLTIQNSLAAQTAELAELKARDPKDPEVAELKAEMAAQAQELQRTRDQLARLAKRQSSKKPAEVVPPAPKTGPKGKTASGVDWI